LKVSQAPQDGVCTMKVAYLIRELSNYEEETVKKPAAQKFSDCCLSNFRIWSGIIRTFQTLLWKFLDLDVNRFTRQKFHTITENIYL
jgi:hypothetical protein